MSTTFVWNAFVCRSGSTRWRSKTNIYLKSLMLAVWAPCTALWVVYVSFDRPKRLGNPSRSRGRTTQNSLSRPLQTSLLRLCISLPVTTSRICNGPTPEDTIRQLLQQHRHMQKCMFFRVVRIYIILGYDSASQSNRPWNVGKYFPVMWHHISKEGNPCMSLQQFCISIPIN